MAEELKREHKLAEQSPPESALTEPAGPENRIDDPRSYLYVEAACRQQRAALSFEVKLKGDSAWYSSDLGQPRLRIDRSGYFRTAIRLPRRITPGDVEQLSVRCDLSASNGKSDDPNPECFLTDVAKVFVLDDLFRPGRSLLSQHREFPLHPGRQIGLIRTRPMRSQR
jgi:hypothetical protein